METTGLHVAPEDDKLEINFFKMNKTPGIQLKAHPIM